MTLGNLARKIYSWNSFGSLQNLWKVWRNWLRKQAEINRSRTQNHSHTTPQNPAHLLLLPQTTKGCFMHVAVTTGPRQCPLVLTLLKMQDLQLAVTNTTCKINEFFAASTTLCHSSWTYTTDWENPCLILPILQLPEMLGKLVDGN